MTGLTPLTALIWLSCPILQSSCVYLLYRRKLLRQFTFFASYLLFLTLLNAVRFLCYRQFGFNSWTYYSVYWVGEAVEHIVIIAVLYEVFCVAFKPFAGLQDLAKIVFKWAAGSLFFIGFVVFLSSPASSIGAPYRWLSTSIFNFERVVGVAEFALLIFLFVASQQLGVAMKNRVFGIALGFGFQALSSLLIYITLATSHKGRIALVTPALQIAFFASLLIWLAYLLKPESASEPIHIPVTSPLLRWNEIALQLGHSGGRVALLNPEPFLPQAERMVEQVMQKEFVERRRVRYAPKTDE